MFHLRRLGQVVGRNKGVTGLFERGEELKGLLESVLDLGRRLAIRRILHETTLSWGCISSFPT